MTISPDQKILLSSTKEIRKYASIEDGTLGQIGWANIRLTAAK